MTIEKSTTGENDMSDRLKGKRAFVTAGAAGIGLNPSRSNKTSTDFRRNDMSDRLKGKRAFVTAGAAGIGRASALAFAREGASVFATDIDEKGLAALAKDGVSEVAKLDVRDTSAVAAMAKRVGPIDILLNAAGFVHHGTVLECSDEDWDFSFDLNVKSMHRTIRAFLPGMLESGRGSIVNISSAAGVFKAAPNRYVYGATKAAVAALTRAVAADFITKGVRCNCICPGTIETPSMLNRAAAAGPGGREMFVSRQPMGRLGTAEEIAALAVYLASDESAFTTGVAHIIDGGWTL
jgi:2-keto-3-deoxy-L-fuconate dehydrogenase